MGSSDEESTEYYSETEVQELLLSLDRLEVARILAWFNAQKCQERTGLTALDVYHQLVEKMLSEGPERSWKRGLSAVTHFCFNGRSILSNETKKNEVASKYRETEIDRHTEAASQLTTSQVPATESAEQALEGSQLEDIAKDLTSKILALFDDDVGAQCYLNQKLNEYKKSTILEICKFTDQVYKNVEKRVKDKVRKRFPNGLPFGE